MNYQLYWTFVEISANLFEAILLFAVLGIFFNKKFSNKTLYIIFPAIQAGFTKAINELHANMLTSLVVLVILSFAYGLFLYQANWRNVIFVVIAYHAVWFISELFVALGIGIIFSISMEDVFQQNYYRLVGIVISKTIQFFILKAIQFFRFKTHIDIPFKTWITLMLFPLATILTTFAWYFLGHENPSRISEVFFAISSLTMLFANIIIFYLFESSHRSLLQQHTLELVSMQTEYEIDRLRQLQDSHQKVRQIAHDLKNRLVPLNILIDTDKKSEALDYLNELQGAINIESSLVDSGNSCIDLLLSQKIQKFQNRGIQFKCNTDNCSNLNIKDEEICIIIGNAIDNAIEACQKISSNEKKTIEISIIRYRNTLMIRIRNPIAQRPQKSNGRYQSSKNDVRSHGIGLKSINQIIDRYQGHLSLNDQEGIFEFCAVLPTV